MKHLKTARRLTFDTNRVPYWLTARERLAHGMGILSRVLLHAVLAETNDRHKAISEVTRRAKAAGVRNWPHTRNAADYHRLLQLF